MPRYVVFFIAASRPQANEAKDDRNIFDDPVFQKILREFLSWIESEIKAERVKDGSFLLDSSADTNIRVDFREPSPVPEAESKDHRSSNSTVKRGHQSAMSTNVLCYYTVEYPTVEDVITWARSCPIAYEGFALEIRELKGTGESIAEAPQEVREMAGRQIVSVRKKMLEEGTMKKEEDGTLWVKVQDEEWVGEIVAEAEGKDEARFEGVQQSTPDTHFKPES